MRIDIEVAKRTTVMLIAVVALIGIFVWLFGWFPISPATVSSEVALESALQPV